MAGDKARGAKVSLPERFKLKEKIIGTTAERLAEVQSEKYYILIVSDIGNSDIVFVGDEERQIIPLLAGGFILLYSDLYDVYVKAESGTQKIHFVAQGDKAIMYELGRLFHSSTFPNQRVNIFYRDRIAEILSSGSDSVDNANNQLIVSAMKMLYNEKNWDRERGNIEVTILPTGTRTGTTNSSDFVNYNHRGIMCLLNISARSVGASPLIKFIIQGKDPITGSYFALLSNQFDPTIGVKLFVLYPGITDSQGLLAGKNDIPLPRTFRVRVEFVQDVINLTYSVGGMLIV